MTWRINPQTGLLEGVNNQAPVIVPQWIKYTLTATDFSVAGLTKTVGFASLGAKQIISGCFVKQSELFTGGLIATYTVSVGIAGTLAKYAVAYNVKQAVSNTAFQIGVALAPTMENYGAITSIVATAVSTVANLDAATQGSVDIWLLISTLP